MQILKSRKQENFSLDSLTGKEKTFYNSREWAVKQLENRLRIAEKIEQQTGVKVPRPRKIAVLHVKGKPDRYFEDNGDYTNGI